MFGVHLKKARDLMEIERYQNKFKHRKRTVAEHSWFVSKISHGLAIWERDKFNNLDVNVENVLFLSINHDVIEGYTGDIISTTKNYSKVMRTELEKIEKMIFENEISQTLPQSWRPLYIQMNKDMSTLSSTDAKIVKAADLIDRMYECMEEIELGNKHPYEAILKSDIEKLFSLELMSGNYFLRYAAKDFITDVYMPENVRRSLEKMDFSMYF